MFGVPTDGLVWLLAGVGLGIFLAMGGFALVASQDRHVHRRRIRAGRKAVAAAIAEEDARLAEAARGAETIKAPPKFSFAAPKPAAVSVVETEPAPPAAPPEPKRPAPSLRLGAALKAAGTAFVREAKVAADVPAASSTAAVMVTPTVVAASPVVTAAPVTVRAPDLLPAPPKPDPVMVAQPAARPKAPVFDTMPAAPLMSANEPRYEPVRDDIAKAGLSRVDAFPVAPRKAHISQLPPIVDNDIVVEPPAPPKPKKPLSEKEEAIAAAAARRRAVAAEKELARKKAERDAAEMMAAERIEAERQAAEREASARRAEATRRLAEREEAERIEAERLAAEQVERDRIERAARDEQERLERAERDEQERAEREEWEREEASRRVAARAAQLREEAERIEAQRRVAERLAALREQEQRQAAEAATEVAAQPRPVARIPSPVARPAVDIEEMFAQAFGASIPTSGSRSDDDQN